MFKKPNCPVIAIEEHYWDPELSKHFTGPEAGRGNETDQRLYDLGSLRLKEMDEAGIHTQVLSHGAPSSQKLPIEIAATLTAQVNDRLAKGCAANPMRFAGLPALPPLVAASGGDRNLLSGLRQGFPAGGAPGLGLHGGNRDAGDPAGAVRRIRRASEAQDHPRPFRRDAAVPGLAHRSLAPGPGPEG